jgi:hypothetical protein
LHPAGKDKQTELKGGKDEGTEEGGEVTSKKGLRAKSP